MSVSRKAEVRYNTKSITLHVEGWIWQGQKCRHRYPIPERQEVPTTLDEARRIAGDFESLTKAKVVTTFREIKETVTTQQLK